ncbi:hypothetical protein BDZ94DRAFT_1263289 [Collybia nuda]|uniref:Uncharacterized protein n=1 Tax=Collybia nuda TaxID=64659 RepID=A0A9P5Y4T6_9AGAR|nr:hypothetical protein BDZ94DRAFT_1263289 [Collybia nuda]
MPTTPSKSMGPQDVFNYIVGALALISAASSAVLYYGPYLPSTQLKILDELLEETRMIYKESCDDDFLPEDLRTGIEEELIELEESRKVLMERTYRAVTAFDQWVAYFQGVSKSLMRASDGVKRVRSRIVTTTEQTRQRSREVISLIAQEQGDEANPQPISSDDRTTSVAENTHMPQTHVDLVDSESLSDVATLVGRRKIMEKLRSLIQQWTTFHEDKFSLPTHVDHGNMENSESLSDTSTHVNQLKNIDKFSLWIQQWITWDKGSIRAPEANSLPA